MSLGQLLREGKALPEADRPAARAKAKPSAAKDARTDAALTRVLLEMTELLSSFRRWKRAEWALDDRLARPELMDHPDRPAAVERWSKAVDRCAEIELALWDLAPAAAAGWVAYSPERRQEQVRLGYWPAVEATVDEATDWLRGEWLFLAWRGALAHDNEA